MSDEQQTPGSPSPLGAVLSGVSQALVPECIRVLDRLIGVAGEIPVAWLKQQTAKIEAQTESYRDVEHAIAFAAAAEAGADNEIVSRAMNVLVRKEYRRQVNREAVAAAMIEDLRSSTVSDAHRMNVQCAPQGTRGPDEDWLNVFERYAEDASTEKMQRLGVEF